MPLTVLTHSIAAHLLTKLRNVQTSPDQFRPLTRSLTSILVSEATRELPTRSLIIRTPLEETQGVELKTEPVLVPILRAGLGMLDAALDLLPTSHVGYVGLERDEKTALARAYYSKLPQLGDRSVLVLDPMLATGGSAATCVAQLYAQGAAHVKLICIVAAPEGVRLLETQFPDLHIVTASLDRELNDKKYILPGLGDFGDRLFGTF
ncbi:MAG: uracil phosphoribosyltransferase [Chthonomonadaceae bacterium]|nr:uracil phosphoribosyltransferase [Chthonomonadaceae bacterium]